MYVLPSGTVRFVAAALRTNTRQLIINRHGIIERQTWSTIVPPHGSMDPDWSYDSIVVHHSGNNGYKNPADIEKLHMNRSGYDDIGYHYMIHPDGRIFEGRDIRFKGAHVSGANTGKIGVLMMGDFDESMWDFDDSLSSSHLQKLKEFSTTLKTTFPVKQFGGHKEFLPNGNYTCPGNLLMDQMQALRTDLSLAAPP